MDANADILCLGFIAGKRLLAGEDSEELRQQASAPASTLSPGVSAILFDCTPVELNDAEVFTDNFLNWAFLTEVNIRRFANSPEPDQNYSATCELTCLPAPACWRLLQSGLGGCAIILAALERKNRLTVGLVGDIFSATAPAAECPRILRDLLASEEIARALGADLVFCLKCVIGPPTGLNLRNVLWHGFLSPAELAPSLPALAFLLLVSTAHHWGRTALRPLLALNTNFLLGPLGDPIAQLTGPIVSAVTALAQQTFFLLPGRGPVLSSALGHLQAWRETLVPLELHLYFALTLPQLEHSLRRMYVTVNSLPTGFLCANARVHYTTLDLFLIPQVELEGVPVTANLLLADLGPGLVALLNDLFIYPEGPRLRDRISHGEADLAQLAPPFVAMYTALLAALMARLSSLQSPELLPLVGWAQDYRSVYHPLPKMRQELARLQSSLQTFDAWMHSLATSDSADPDSFEATYSLRNDESLEASVHSLVDQIAPADGKLVAQECTAVQLAAIAAVRQTGQELVATLALLTSKTSSLRQLVQTGQATRRLETSLYKLMSLLPSFSLAFRFLVAFLARESVLLRAGKAVRACLTVIERLGQRFEANEWTEAGKLLQQQLPPLCR